jgi:hypothetical protein
MSVSNERLIDLFEMLIERLSNIEKSQDTMMKHLKNKCLDERKLDKDLFELPINVDTYYHGNDRIDTNTFIYVNHEFPDDIPEHCLSITKPYVYDKVKSFLPKILSNKQIEKLDKFLSVADINNDDSKKKLTCVELDICCWFSYVSDYILNAYVKHMFPNVEWVFPSFEANYSFVLKNMTSIPEAVEYVESIFKHFGCSLANFATKNNRLCVTLCQSEFYINLEVLLNTPACHYDMLEMCNGLDIRSDHVEKYIDRFQKAMEQCTCNETSNLFTSHETMECFKDTLISIRDILCGNDEDFSDDDDEVEVEE